MEMALRTIRINFISTLLITLLSVSSANADELSPKLQVKLEIYKMKLVEWAKDPDIINAVINSNTKIAKMNNTKWKPLTASDTKVKPFLTSAAGKKLFVWEKDRSLGKLFLRDKNGNLVAGSKKPAIFNIAKRPAFINAFRGKIWNSKKVKSDPTTSLSSIQLSIPVKNNGKEIGVLHTSVIAN